MIVAAIVIIIVIIAVMSIPTSTNVPCYTVSEGKDWSGTYYLNNSNNFGGRRAFTLQSGAYSLVWDSSTTYWTFLSTAQLQRVITSGLIATDGSGARTAIVSDNNGNPANSTAINDWLSSDAKGTFSPNCLLAKNSV